MTVEHTPTVRAMGVRARAAARTLRSLGTAEKNAALHDIARELRARAQDILRANADDVEAARTAGLPEHLIDRLTLNAERLDGITRDVENVAGLPDPVGETFDDRTLDNGLHVTRVRVPLGVLGVIYEARPNVTVDVATLALKSGNAVILRGGKETARSNAALVDAIGAALERTGLPADAVQVILDPDRERMRELLRLDDLVDAIIPRGGAGLHRYCVENATVPVIVGGVGVVHLYLDASFTRAPDDADAAVRLIRNAKVQKPSACNALDTLLIHQGALGALPGIVRDLQAHGVDVVADAAARAALDGLTVGAATPGDYGTEFLALKVSVKVVRDLDEALDFIAAHGGHTDVILTRDDAQARRFVQDVDSAAVMVNASPRFNDGAQLGLGAEVAISTQKLHARGPMALAELTTNKWVVRGDGQTRA
ncbi:glutamate-5-semialdehyde dehydrogenase [Deinococcus maricopensis]|uniref:Gamma-glutamyl phosphate reductase n=1 Tax=Deinococcus maricopensis (strain DSM 21211 / LMG 22137 / NRRL B-23946 / LB-34) TaxID=709986 RepID=E8UAB4_DEIML|nr:glutamate-5-semialdehyde dehydrogenase [Deinococcus maricopensis]ADV68003.1 Gamma-glutamyl phosphate reductase [Deinococcus maricopensis DSM 21211]